MNRVYIFFISLFIAILFLVIERAFGIKWNYHPDAETYIYESPVVALNLIEEGIISFFNNFYFLISLFLSSNIDYLIILNMIIYSLTNIVIYDIINEYKKINVNNLSFWILVLIPYRLHLSVHVLKDTLIIFFLFLIFSKNVFSKSSFLFILLMRVFSVFYFVVLIPSKYYKVLFVFILSLIIFFNTQISSFLSEKNEVSMTFREFDNVPTFSEFGLFGIFIRAIIWPFLTMTGLYLFISPSIAFFPVALGSFIVQLWCKFYLKVNGIVLQVYFSCFLIALFVNGFTSYLRYTFPLILIIPIILLEKKYGFYKKSMIIRKKII